MPQSGSTPGSFFEIHFVLDRSGSMGGTSSQRREAVNLVLDQMIDGLDRAGGVNFASGASLKASLSSDLESVRDKMSYPSSGGTSIRSGISTALSDFSSNSEPGARRVIILLTDGRDGTSCSWVKNAVPDDMAFYTVGFGGASAGKLRCMADAGDGTGQFYWASNFVGIFGDIIDDILEDRVTITGQKGLLYVLVNYLIDHEQNDYVQSGDEVVTRPPEDWEEWMNPVNSDGKAKLKISRGDETIYEDEQYHKYKVGESRMYVVSDSADEGASLDNESVDWELDIENCDDQARWNISFGATVQSNHYHDPLPGIIEEFEDIGKLYPNNLELKVNGSSVATFSGSGDSQETWEYDVTDDLEPGQVNTITISSEELGHLMAFVEGDVYRQIVGSG